MRPGSQELQPQVVWRGIEPKRGTFGELKRGRAERNVLREDIGQLGPSQAHVA